MQNLQVGDPGGNTFLMLYDTLLASFICVISAAVTVVLGSYVVYVVFWLLE